MMNLIRLFLPSTLLAAREESYLRYRLLQARQLLMLACMALLAIVLWRLWVWEEFFLIANSVLLAVAAVYPLGLYAMGRTRDRLALCVVRLLWGPSDAAWMAELDRVLDVKYPRWRTVETTSPKDAAHLSHHKAKLARHWLQLKPDCAEDLHAEAWRALNSVDNSLHYGALDFGISYRDWEVKCELGSLALPV